MAQKKFYNNLIILKNFIEIRKKNKTTQKKIDILNELNWKKNFTPM